MPRSDIDTLIVAKHLREIENYRATGAKYDVRVLAPSIQKGQIVGRLINMVQDTLDPKRTSLLSSACFFNL